MGTAHPLASAMLGHREIRAVYAGLMLAMAWEEKLRWPGCLGHRMRAPTGRPIQEEP